MTLRHALTVGILAAGLGAWPVAAQVTTFRYNPPERRAAGVERRYVELPADRVLAMVQSDLKSRKMLIESIDRAQRTIVARYSGDGRRYMDCGTVEQLLDGKPQRPTKQYSANRPDARTFRVLRGRRVGLYREMLLDARVVIQLEPSGKGTEVASEAVYVVTKSVYQVVKGGGLGMLADREIVSFRSSETGRFEKGTRCVPTGRLEELATAAFRDKE